MLGDEGGAGCWLESHCGGHHCPRGAAERLGPFQGGFSGKPPPWCRLLPDCRHVLWHLLGFWMLAPQRTPSSPMLPPTHAHMRMPQTKCFMCTLFGSKLNERAASHRMQASSPSWCWASGARRPACCPTSSTSSRSCSPITRTASSGMVREPCLCRGLRAFAVGKKRMPCWGWTGGPGHGTAARPHTRS